MNDRGIYITPRNDGREPVSFKHVHHDVPSMSAEETVREYYESLRRGEPLYPYFLESCETVKVGIGERLIGYETVAEGLREQSRTTDDWTVGSTDLRTTETGDTASFSDTVQMQWRDTTAERWLDYETRWTGTLVRRDEEWQFVVMHVSASVDGDGNVVGVDDGNLGIDAADETSSGGSN